MPVQPEIPHRDVRPEEFIRDGCRTLVDMTVPATEMHVRHAVGLTMNKLSAFQITPDLQVSIEIVLAELLNNIVEHGYPDGASSQIHLQILKSDDWIEINTLDRGVQMPGLKAPHPPDPDLTVERKDLPEGQFGWFMIRKLCQSFEYQRHGDQNQLSLRLAP